MSVKIMTFIFGLQGLSSRDKFVALAYADHADDEGGSIFPARTTVAKKTSKDPRTVTRATRHLEEIGLFIADGIGKNNVKKWRINLNWVGSKSPDLESQVGTDDTPSRDTTPTNTSVNHQLTTANAVVQEPKYVDVGKEFQESEKKPIFKRAVQREYVGAISAVTGLDLNMNSNYSRMSKVARELFQAGYASKQIIHVYSEGGAWYKKDFRGEKGQKPSPELIPRTIKNLLEQPKTLDDSINQRLERMYGKHPEYNQIG